LNKNSFNQNVLGCIETKNRAEVFDCFSANKNLATAIKISVEIQG